MIITYHGLGCLKIQTNGTKILIDPYSAKSGLKPLNASKLESDIVLISNQAETLEKIPSNNSFLINSAGEYEVKDVFVYGIPSVTKKIKNKVLPITIFSIEIEKITIAYLSLIGGPLSNGQLEKLEGADILIIPVGGELSLTAREAMEVISQIEPRIIIPIHYKIKGLKTELNPLTLFCKEMGVKEEEGVEKLKVNKKDLPQEETKVIIMKP